MGDPVNRLNYSIRSRNPHDTFHQADRWRGALGPWEVDLTNGALEATTSQPFADVASARSAFEPLLRAWEAVAYLEGQYEIEFRHDGPAARKESASSMSIPTGGLRAAVPEESQIYRRDNEAYPLPDNSFTLSSLVGELLEGINQMRRGEASPPEVAGTLLSKMDLSAASLPGGVPEAYNVSPEVVEVLRELASRTHPTRQGPPAARRYRGPEWQWMQEAIRLLTLQVGRAAAGDPANVLRMVNFRTQL